jgi:hypothetical protein
MQFRKLLPRTRFCRKGFVLRYPDSNLQYSTPKPQPVCVNEQDTKKKKKKLRNRNGKQAETEPSIIRNCNLENRGRERILRTCLAVSCGEK